jgi:hypothetical protein
VANDLTADPVVEAVNLAAIELTTALVLLLLNKFCQTYSKKRRIELLDHLSIWVTSGYII